MTVDARQPPSAPELRVGVSSCLAGENVRYNGENKRDGFVVGALADRVTLVPVCPELELGLGVPREPLRLELSASGETKLVGTESGHDHTAAMETWAQRRIDELERLELSGYVLKARSPSCGLASVPLYPAGGEATDPTEAIGSGSGLFAKILTERLPALPVEDEASLADPACRERFLERVLNYGDRG